MGIISREKVNGLCACLFIIGIAALFYIGYPNVWAGMMIAGGGAMVIRQLLLGRLVGLVVVVIVFGACWASTFYGWYQQIVIPLSATIGALYILVVQLGYRDGRGEASHSEEE